MVAASPQIKKKGRGSAAGCVEGLHPTGETTHYDLCVAGAPSNHVRCASLRSGGDSACGAEGGGLPLCGNAYKVSVTDLPFCVIWHDRHSADWLAVLASPYPATPDFPLFRGQNKTPRNTLFINGSTVSTGYSATVHILHRMCKLVKVSPKPAHKRALLLIDQPNCGGWQRNWIHRGAPRPTNPVTRFPPGKVVAPATKGGMHFRRPQGGRKVFL